MMKIHQYSMLCASIISQEAALEAILHGETDTIEMREQYRLRRNFIVNAFNAAGLECHLPRGSFYAFPSIRSTGLTAKEFAMKLLEQEKVACVPGSAFGPGGEGYLRCCFAASLDQIQVATERIGRFVQRCQA
jgi:aminotransferase